MNSLINKIFTAQKRTERAEEMTKKTQQLTNARRFKKGGFLDEMSKNWPIYLMAVPGVALLFVFHYMPMFGVAVAFQDYSPGLGVFGSEWIGFTNFMRYFESPYFGRTMSNTIILSLYSIIVTFPAPIILALLLNEIKSNIYKRFAQTLTYVPFFISTVVIGGLLLNFSRIDGLFNVVLSFFGFEKQNLLMQPKLFKTIYVLSDLWQFTGWNSIVYLAALTSIDHSLYEAAMLDGAGRFKQAIHVTIPGIVPTIVTLFILKVGGLMSLGYEKIILIYNPSTYATAETIGTYVYTKGLKDMDYAYSTAVGLFQSVINLALLTITNKISVKLTDTGLW